MADEYEEEGQESEEGNQDIRNLRKAAKERDGLAAQVAAQGRELAFAKAKLDLDDPKLKYFMKGYEGEMTSEAIRAQAEADGFIAPSEKTQQAAAEGNAQQRIAGASSGAADTPSPDFHQLVSEANSVEEVMKLAIQQGMHTSWNRPGG
jgi:hypothetical protein